MRIISKHRDYYDGVQAMGLDMDNTYVRKQEEHTILRKDIPSKLADLINDAPIGRHHHLRTTYGLIGFCGIIYPVFRMYLEEDQRDILTYAYTVQDIRQALKQSKYNNAKEYLHRFNTHTKGIMYRYSFNQLTTEKALSHIADDSLFHKLNAPIFYLQNESFDRDTNVRTYTLKVNMCLRDMNFYKIKDSYQAFQDISMYVGGVLKHSDPSTIQVSDTVMRDAKGFDKWSFKKKPTKHKK